MGTRLKFGLLLPHFCEHASVVNCLEGARKAEAYGFDSLWVRDHIVFQPYKMEGEDKTHIEGLLTLAAIAAVTKKPILGTAMAICHRHPIHLAQLFAGLSAISHGRVVMGMGLGGFPHEFAAAGRPSTLVDRANLARINAEICRRLWAGAEVSIQNDYFCFNKVALNPLPVDPIPIWIGGSTPASCRRAMEYGDGWMPARITLATFEKRLAELKKLCTDAGRKMITTGVMPLTSIGKDKETARNQVNLKGLLEEANRNRTWVAPSSGAFSTLEDIRGLVLAGSPRDIVTETRDYEESGVEHIVYDLRFRFADWHEQLDLLGKEVLPALRT